MAPAASGQRGAHVVDAALRVIADAGFPALSMRTVAAAAGVSLAQVQYYFRSKDELLAAAFERVGGDLVARARQVDTSGPTRQVLRALLHEWLPLDRPRARAARVWSAFTAAAAASPTLGPMNQALDEELRTDFAAALRDAQAAGELNPDLDAGIEAALLLAVLDGLVLQALALPADERAELLVTGLDTHLDRLFGGGSHDDGVRR